MNKYALGFAAVGALAIFAARADAQHHRHYHPSSPRANHERHHDDLDHRAFHRELEHREAHRYPMTWRQHERLHDHLDHEAYHDYLEHRGAHRSGAYYAPSYRHNPYYYRGGYGYQPYGSGFGIQGRNFSFWFGR